MANKNMNQAKNAKNDEFYTQLVDIENELKHYRTHFKGNRATDNIQPTRNTPAHGGGRRSGIWEK